MPSALRIRPFRAIHPQPNLAARVAAPPYDVVDYDEAMAIASGNPLSFLHVSRAEIDLPPGTPPYDDAVYAAGRKNFERFLSDGSLVQEEAPGLYLYRLVRNHRPQIGLVVCCHVDDYARDVIKRHEKTRKVKEDDRTRHLLTVGAHTGPVFLTYRDDRTIDRLVRREVNARPLFHFNADAAGDVTHTVWRVSDPREWIEAFGRVPCAYVADGHHRAAAAVRGAAELAAANPDHKGDEEYNWFLTALYPASQLTILPYNRIVRDLGHREGGLGERDPDEILTALAEAGDLHRNFTSSDAPPPRRSFDFYLAGAWHRLTFDDGPIDSSDPVASLDVAILQDRVLTPIFGIGDPRTDQRLDFVGGIHGRQGLRAKVDSGAWAVAVALHPTSIDELMAIADAGLVMPPKSTWFEPKLRSGLLVHALREEPVIAAAAH